MKHWIGILILICLLLAVGCSKKKSASDLPGQVKPGSPEYLMNEGLVFLNEGNLPMAESKLMGALKKNPNLIKALNALGLIYTYRKDFPKAIEYFRRAIQRNPKYYDAYNSLGMVYVELGKFELAKSSLIVAANADGYRTPENAFVNLALLEIKRGNMDQAMRYIENGFEKNQNFAPLYNLKGVVLENKNELEKALENYKKALDLIAVEDVNYLINIGRIYHKLGKKQRSLDFLEKALARTTDSRLKAEIQKMIKLVEGN